MFKLISNPAFEFEAQLGGAGLTPPVKLRLHAKVLGREALQAWAEQARTAASDAQWLAQVLIGWADVVDAQDQPVPFSIDALGQLLAQHPRHADQLFRAYTEALLGAREKN